MNKASELWGTINRNNIAGEAPKERRKRQKMFEEIMATNNSTLMKKY